MDKTPISPLFLIIPLGIVAGIVFIMSDEATASKLYARFHCKSGRHTFKKKWSKSNSYYCLHCKAPRDFPKLKLLEGGNKMGKFLF